MLIAQGTKREAGKRFKSDVRFDLVEDGQTIGGFVYAIGPETAEVTHRGAVYSIGRPSPRKDDTLLGKAVRLATGGGKPEPNPILLRDAAGAVLARAEEARGGAAIEAGGRRFALRRRFMLSRRYDLYPEPGERALGSVGRSSLFSTSMTADFPPEVPELFQAFLLALLVDMSIVALDRIDRSTANA